MIYIIIELTKFSIFSKLQTSLIWHAGMVSVYFPALLNTELLNAKGAAASLENPEGKSIKLEYLTKVLFFYFKYILRSKKTEIF